MQRAKSHCARDFFLKKLILNITSRRQKRVKLLRMQEVNVLFRENRSVGASSTETTFTVSLQKKSILALFALPLFDWLKRHTVNTHADIIIVCHMAHCHRNSILPSEMFHALYVVTWILYRMEITLNLVSLN